MLSSSQKNQDVLAKSGRKGPIEQDIKQSNTELATLI